MNQTTLERVHRLEEPGSPALADLLGGLPGEPLKGILSSAAVPFGIEDNPAGVIDLSRENVGEKLKGV